jgi:tetratricopeptide (TPR) repeat protein
VVEMRELESLFPDSPMCHRCLAFALYTTMDFAGAEKEYGKAIELDPTDALAHVGLGSLREAQQNHDAALNEFQEAERLDPGLTPAYREAARVLIKKGNYARALDQLERAENLAPSDSAIHDLYGQALEASGKTDAAISEFQQSIALNPEQIPVLIELASAFEKKGDWVAAIGEYKKASLADASVDLRGKVVYLNARDPQNEYEAAQIRLKDHLAALRAAGKPDEAAKIEAGIQSAETGSGLSEQLDAAMQAGANADKARHFDEAIGDYQQAVDLADKLQPHDPRLVTALDYLGKNYAGQNPAAAQAAFEREFKVAQELFGPENPHLTGPLQSLGINAVIQHDYPTAEKYFFRAVDINEKFFGEGSDKVADALVQATSVYFADKDYAKAEPYLLRALTIDESFHGKDSPSIVIPLSRLCAVYERWDKPEKLEPCEKQLLGILETQYGSTSPVLATVIASEAKALRSLGRNDEAARLEDRLASIRAASMKPN